MKPAIDIPASNDVSSSGSEYSEKEDDMFEEAKVEKKQPQAENTDFLNFLEPTQKEPAKFDDIFGSELFPSKKIADNNIGSYE